MSEPVPTGDEPADRQCGRCRKTFDGDPTAHPTALQEWWRRPACHDALLGAGA